VILTLFPTFTTLYVGRFIVGVSSGLNTVIVPLYIKELTPIKFLGITSLTNPVVYDVGSLLAFLFGLGYSSEPTTEQ
jgi:MFS family permease